MHVKYCGYVKFSLCQADACKILWVCKVFSMVQTKCTRLIHVKYCGYIKFSLCQADACKI